MLAANLCRIGRTRLSVPNSSSACAGSVILQRCAASSDSNSKSPDGGDKSKQKPEKDEKKEDQWFGRKKLMDKVDLGFKKKPDLLAEDATSTTAAEKEVQIPSNLLKAAKSVAEDLGGNVQQTESELVQKLKDQAKVNLSDIFLGMKIDKGQQPSQDGVDRSVTSSLTDGSGSRAQRVRRILDDQSRYQQQRSPAGDPRRDRRPDRQYMQKGREYMDREGGRPRPPVRRKVDLFGARPLGVFTVKPDSEYRPVSVLPKLSTWDLLEAKELKLAVTHPPRNGFEEMILWTEQGKLWKFPIDNEQGMDEEVNIPFHEHVFLEPLIEPWCPKKGPLRHFMELVCVALGKNHFMTLKEKREYIEWYHQFFLERSAVLKETGTGEVLK